MDEDLLHASKHRRTEGTTGRAQAHRSNWEHPRLPGGSERQEGTTRRSRMGDAPSAHRTHSDGRRTCTRNDSRFVRGPEERDDAGCLRWDSHVRVWMPNGSFLPSSRQCPDRRSPRWDPSSADFRFVPPWGSESTACSFSSSEMFHARLLPLAFPILGQDDTSRPKPAGSSVARRSVPSEPKGSRRDGSPRTSPQDVGGFRRWPRRRETRAFAGPTSSTSLPGNGKRSISLRGGMDVRPAHPVNSAPSLSRRPLVHLTVEWDGNSKSLVWAG